MYKNSYINSNIFNPKTFTNQMSLSFMITNLTFKIDANTAQYNYQAGLLKIGEVPAHKQQEFSVQVNCLGMEIQNDKSRLVELGKAMAALTQNVDPKNYRPKL